MCIVLSAGSALGAERTVDDSGAWADFNSVQEAVDAASAGDTILVYEGNYVETVVVNKTVSIVGNGSSVSVIDSGGAGTAVTVSAPDVNISDMGMEGGIVSEPSAAVLVEGADGASIFNCRIDADLVNGLYVKQTDGFTATDCSIAGTVLHGIVLASSSGAAFDGVELDDRGVFMTGPSPEFHDTHSFTDCTVGGKALFYASGGQAVEVPEDAGQAILAGCRFGLARNLSLDRGNIGVHVSYCDGVYVEFCTIGGMMSGIYSFMSTNTTVVECEISDCGAGVEISTGSHGFRVRDTVVGDCDRGISILASEGVQLLRAEVNGCTFGIQALPGSGDIAFRDSEFSECTTGIRLSQCEGGEIVNCTVARSAGTGIDLDLVEGLRLIDCTATDNDGTGVQVINGTGMDIEGLLVQGNGGSGLCADGSGSVIESCVVQENAADGICISGDGQTVLNTSAEGNGGNGLAFSGDGHLVRWCEMEGNRQGMMMVIGSSNVTVSHNRIANSTEYGLLVSSMCSGYTIFRNEFDGNGMDTSQGYDMSGGGLWDDGSRGNWWSGFNTTNEDGNPIIWDEPYPIDGPGEASDRYPIVGEIPVLEVAIELDSTSPLHGREVTIYVIVDTELDLGHATLTVTLDGETLFTESREMSIGRHAFTHRWKAVKGVHTLHAGLVAGEQGGQDTLEVTVVGRGRTGDYIIKYVPDAALAFLAIVSALLIMFNLRRPLFRLLKHERK